jgi:hypothetical protein
MNITNQNNHLKISPRDEMEYQINAFVDAFGIDYSEAKERLHRYNDLFRVADLNESLALTDDVCVWIMTHNLPKNVTKLYRYSCFKFHVGYIDNEIKNKIMIRALKNLDLNQSNQIK